MKVLILGSGLLGVTTAYVLAARGHTVEVIDRQPESGMETSFANGGQLSYSTAEPWANPHVLWKLPKWLMHADSPLVFRLTADPDMYIWLLRFLRNCTTKRAERNCMDTLRLNLYSRLKMQEIIDNTSIQFDHSPRGILHIFANKGELQHATRQMEFQAKFGGEHRVLSAAEVLALEPALQQSRVPLAGGIHATLDASADAYKFCVGLAQYCIKQYGVKFHYGASLESFAVQNDKIAYVVSTQGEHTADAYVMALGAYSRLFLNGLGISVPIYPMKGYSFTVPASGQLPGISVTDSSHKIVFTQLGDVLRVAGTAEFAGYDDSISPERLAPMDRAARQLFPNTDWNTRLHEWACLRPQTPTGNPLLGPTPMANLFLNTGHGTLGWTHAAGSAYIVADAIENRLPEITIGGLTLEKRMKELFYDWGGLNGWLFKLINGLSGNASYDSLMLLFSRLGAKENFHYYFGLMIAYTIGEIWLLKLRHKPITQQHIKSALALLITMVMGFMVAGLAVGVSKTIIGLPRPFVLPDINAAMTQGKLHFLEAAPPATDYYSSFPSGHAATIAFLVTVLWHKFSQKPFHYAGIALAVLVCWSRIAVGMHFPADVLAGAFIGWFSASYVRLYVYRTLRVPLPGQTLAVKVATIPAATPPAPPQQQPTQPMHRNAGT